MPRTKVRKQNTVKSRLEEENLKGRRKHIAEIRKIMLDAVEMKRASAIDQLEARFVEKKMQIYKKYNNLKLKELENLKSFSSLSSSCISNEDIANLTKSVRTNNKLQRSSSCAGDDEGYNTTESNHSGTRASRSRTKKATQKTRLSRSLSKNNNIPVTLSAPNSNDKTPLNKATPPNDYGMITPKVKPNTPLVLLRRPKVGEVALSMQGSPLLTAPIMTDQSANINIPLVDGTLLSLQAQRGLRRSQIPDLDPDVKRQLEMLRENLNLII